MPTLDRTTEREIVRRGIQRGLSEEQIKTAVTTFREQGLQKQAATTRSAGPLERLMLSFGDAQGREQFLQKRGISEENVNKPGFDLGDITSKAGGLLPSLLGTAGFGAGGLLGAAAGAPTGPGAVGTGAVGAIAGGTAGEVAGEGLRQSIGQLLGVQAQPGGMEQAQDISSAAKTGAISSVLGRYAGPVIGKAIERAPGKLIQRALRPNPTLVTKIKTTAKSFGETSENAYEVMGRFAKRGFWGSRDQMLHQADELITKSKTARDSLIKNSTKKVSVDPLFEALTKTKATFSKAGDSVAVRKIGAFADDLAKQVSELADDTGKIPVQAAQQFKDAYQTALTSAKFGKTVTGLPEAQKTAKSLFKKQIDESVKGVKELNEAISDGSFMKNMLSALDGKAASALSDSISRSVLTGLGGGIGSAIGFMSGGPVGIGIGGSVGATTGNILSRALTSIPVRTTRAQLSRRAGYIIKSPGAKEAGQVLLRLLLQKENK